MLIVADSSSLIALAICDALFILDQLFETIKVPQIVLNEVTVKGKPAAIKLSYYLLNKVIPIDKEKFAITYYGIGDGELAAMILYKQLNANYLLIDDKKARNIARLNKIEIIGSQGVLLLAKHKGIINQVKPFLNLLLDSDIHISQSLIYKTLLLAGEF